MPNKNIPLMVPAALKKEIERAAKATCLPQAEVMRQSMRLGLPKLVSALAQQEDDDEATAAMLRKALAGPFSPLQPGELRRITEKIISEKRRNAA